MFNKIPFAAFLLHLLLFASGTYAQAPDLGRASGFVLFTATGIVSNTGSSHLTGNIGTQTGAIYGFGNVDGVMHSGDTATAQASADLLVAYSQLNAIPSTAAHAPVLGGGETLFAGVYNITGSGSTVSDLNLDALGDPNALFIFRISGNFSAGPSSQVILIHGAVACNVFWQVEGAATMAALSYMRGTFIANNGAMTMAAGSKLEGRLLSTTGTISVDRTVACMPLGCGVPILTGPPAPGLASTQGYALFTALGSVSNSGVSNITGDIGSNAGTVSGFDPALVNGTIHPTPDASTSQCAVDLHQVSRYLDSLPYDIELLYPTQFGGSLVLTPHVYRMNGVTLLTDTLFLNAQGNSSAVFVIQVNGDFLTSSQCFVQLQNGACADHVFWKMYRGAIVNTSCNISGNLICNSSVFLNCGTILNGRALRICLKLDNSHISCWK